MFWGVGCVFVWKVIGMEDITGFDTVLWSVLNTVLMVPLSVRFVMVWRCGDAAINLLQAM